MPRGNKEAYKNNSNFGDKLYSNLEAGEISTILSQAIEINSWKKIDLNSDDEVENRINEYWKYCVERDTRPAVAGLAMALGVDRMTLSDWRYKRSRNVNNRRSEIIKNAYSTLEFMWENYMQTGKINPASGCFLGKNNFGYHDESKLVVEAQTGPQPTLTPEEIADKIAADIPLELEDKGVSDSTSFLEDVKKNFAEV